MALSGSNVSRGIGHGQAQVYNTSGNINLYARTLQQQQAKREHEARVLQSELAKVKVDGVRQPDIPEFTQKYNDWKNSYAAIQGERDTNKKIALRRDFDQRQIELQQLVADSKALSKGEDEFTKMLLNPNIRDRYKEDAVDRFQKSRTLSRNDKNFTRDLSQLEHQVDLSEIMQELDKEDAEVMAVSRFSDPIERAHTQGNRKGVMIEQSRAIDPKQQALRYAAKFDLDPKFRVAVRELYPDLANLSNDQLKAQVIPDLVKQRAKTEFKAPVFKENEDKSLEMARLALSQRREDRLASGDNVNPGDYEVERVELMTRPSIDKDGNTIKGSERIAATLDKSVKVRSVAFPSTQMKSAFEIAIGKNVPLSSKSDLKLARIGYVTVKGNKKELKAIVVDSGNKEYIIDEREIPIDIRKNKAYRAALEALGSPPAVQESKQGAAKGYAPAIEKGIEAVMERNGISREQAINALKAAKKI